MQNRSNAVLMLALVRCQYRLSKYCTEQRCRHLSNSSQHRYQSLKNCVLSAHLLMMSIHHFPTQSAISQQSHVNTTCIICFIRKVLLNLNWTVYACHCVSKSSWRASVRHNQQLGRTTLQTVNLRHPCVQCRSSSLLECLTGLFKVGRSFVRCF